MALPLLILSMACSGSENRLAEESANIGRADAQHLIEAAPRLSAMKMEGALIQIRANEFAYREQGHSKAADAYIKAFETYMRENSDSLARLIFNE